MNINCPECKSQEIKNEGDGILSCKQCELIFDSGPQWTKYNPTVPSPNQIDIQTTEKQAASKIILKWQNEIRNGNLGSRSILLASEEIERICNELKLGDNIKESALELFSSSSKVGIVRGRSSEKVAAASIYTACRMVNVPRTLDEVASRTSLNRNELSKLHRLITRKLKLQIHAAGTANFISRFSNKLGLPKIVEEEATKTIETLEANHYSHGISPNALLGATLYLACKKMKVRRSQLEIAKVVGTSEVTLRNRSKQIFTLLNSK